MAGCTTFTSNLVRGRDRCRVLGPRDDDRDVEFFPCQPANREVQLGGAGHGDEAAGFHDVRLAQQFRIRRISQNTADSYFEEVAQLFLIAPEKNDFLARLLEALPEKHRQLVGAEDEHAAATDGAALDRQDPVKDDRRKRASNNGEENDGRIGRRTNESQSKGDRGSGDDEGEARREKRTGGQAFAPAVGGKENKRGQKLYEIGGNNQDRHEEKRVARHPKALEEKPNRGREKQSEGKIQEREWDRPCGAQALFPVPQGMRERAEIYLQPGGKHQEGESKLGQEIERRGRLHEVETALADDNTGEDFADHDREAPYGSRLKSTGTSTARRVMRRREKNADCGTCIGCAKLA
jgi:hypothetical protein